MLYTTQRSIARGRVGVGCKNYTKNKARAFSATEFESPCSPGRYDVPKAKLLEQETGRYGN